MKRVLLILGLVAVSAAADSACWAAISRVNVDHNAVGNTNATTIATPGISHTAGNLLVVGIGWNSTTITVTSVTDTAGDTFVQCSGALASLAGPGSTDIWSTGSTAGNATNIVTAHFSLTINFRSIAVIQYAGAANSGCETAQSGTANPSTTVTSAAFSPAASGNVNVAQSSSGSAGTWTADGNYAQQVTESVATRATEDRLAAPSGSQTASETLSISAVLCISVASFKPSGGAACTPTLTLLHVGRCG